MVVAGSDRSSLLSVQAASTATFRPLYSRSGLFAIYQLSFVPFDKAIKGIVRAGLFRTPDSDSALEHQTNHGRHLVCAGIPITARTRRSTAQDAPLPPSYSDKPGTATIVARGDGVARLCQSRASEVVGVRASDPRKGMGGMYCMWESAGVGSGIPAYRPAGDGEVVIN